MSGEPLTVAEAVPLGTVHLQRLLESAAIRSLVIKGPAFVELGVRKPRTSNDIDLLVHQDDRAGATEVLAAAGWSIISHWFPPALDDIIYSTTFRHPLFPVTLDLHHRFSGLLAGSAAFDVLWERRTEVALARQRVVTVGHDDALIIEGLNAIKLLPNSGRPKVAQRVIEGVENVDLARVTAAAESLGARHTAGPVIAALGGNPPKALPPPGYQRWLVRGDRNRNRDLALDLLKRAPMHIPRVIYQQLTLDQEVARFWAHANSVPYRSRWQVLALRVSRLVRRRSA